MNSPLITTGLPQPQGLGEDPLYYFTTTYLVFLQNLFNQFPEGSYKWSDDEKVSEITITDQAPIPKDRLEQRPAIITMRGPAQFANLSLDNMQSIDPHTGKKRRSDLVSCTMTLNAIAKVGPEAQRIAWTVARHLRTFLDLIQRQSGMHQIGNQLSIGNESPPGAFIQPEADSEMVMVTVQSPFFFKWTEETTPLDALRAKLEASMAARLGPIDTTGVRQQTVLRQPTVRGVPVGNSIPLDSSSINMTVKP